MKKSILGGVTVCWRNIASFALLTFLFSSVAVAGELKVWTAMDTEKALNKIEPPRSRMMVKDILTSNGPIENVDNYLLALKIAAAHGDMASVRTLGQMELMTAKENATNQTEREELRKMGCSKLKTAASKGEQIALGLLSALAGTGTCD